MMLEVKKVDWETLIDKEPDRYLLVYDEKSNEMIEVHDKKNGNIWLKVNEGWMHI